MQYLILFFKEETLKVKIAHCADLHLESKSETKNYETKETFLNMLGICKSENVDFLLISGDFFDDTNVSEKALIWVKNELENFGLKTVISPGNHDPFTNDSPYNKGTWPKNVYIFKENKLTHFDFPELKTKIFGVSFTSIYQKKTLFNLKENLDNDFLNLCVMHGTVTKSSDEFYNPISPSEIEKSGFDYVALGHIHKRSEILKLGETFCAYSGSICPKGFSETGAKGIYIGEVSKNEHSFKFKRVCKHSYEKFTLDISGVSNISDFILESIKSNFGEGFENNSYEITLTGEIEEEFNLDIDAIKLFLSSHLHFASIKDKTETKIDFAKLNLRNDFKSLFIKEALNQINQAGTKEEKEIAKTALKLGLKAFTEDVTYNDN